MTVAISEPDARLAAADMTLAGRVEGDELMLEGTRRWCPGAGRAEQHLVYFREPGVVGARSMSAAVVDRERAGLTKCLSNDRAKRVAPGDPVPRGLWLLRGVRDRTPHRDVHGWASPTALHRCRLVRITSQYLGNHCDQRR